MQHLYVCMCINCWNVSEQLDNLFNIYNIAYEIAVAVILLKLSYYCWTAILQ